MNQNELWSFYLSIYIYHINDNRIDVYHLMYYRLSQLPAPNRPGFFFETSFIRECESQSTWEKVFVETNIDVRFLDDAKIHSHH